MALVTNFTCSRCGLEHTELVTPERVCSVCRGADAAVSATARVMYLTGLTALTTNERLARLEAAAYDARELRRRIEVIEAANTRY